MKLAFFEVDQLDQKIYINAFPQDEVIFFDHELINNVPLAARDADVISIFVCSIITAEVLKQFSRLQFIALRATGYDNIAIDEAIKYGIQIARVPDYAIQTVAEYVFALLLCLSRKIYNAYYRLQHEHSFSHKNLQGFDLYKKKLGIVGTGNIGKKVISIAQGFEMEIIAYDIFPDQEYAYLMNFSYFSFEDLLSQSDIITFHVPLNKATHYMLNKKNISLVKKGAYIINTARGGVIQTDALVEALDKNIIAGAALDVLEEECFTRDPLSLLIENSPEKNELKEVSENHYLINHPKVIVTPHNAFNSYEAVRRLIIKTVENIIAWQKGKPINLVFKR